MRFEVMSSKIGENQNYKIFRKTKNEIEIIEIKEEGCDYLDLVIFYFPITKDICEKIRSLVETYKTNNTVCIVGINTDKGEWYKAFDLMDYYFEFSKIFDMAGTINKKDEFEALVDIFYSCSTISIMQVDRMYIIGSYENQNMHRSKLCMERFFSTKKIGLF